MIHGIGTDMVTIGRIEHALTRFGDRFLHRILNQAEVAEFAQAPYPARFVAKRFAAKEAFSKAYGTGIGAVIGWHDVGVAHDDAGRPIFVLSKKMQLRFINEHLGACHVSITDENLHAVAFAVIERDWE